jgi:acyl-CoA thioester hydrolase
MPVTTEVRVRYAETDQMGIVYYANYFVWFEIGRVEVLRTLGLSYRDLEVRHLCILPVVEASCRYRSPARYDDQIQIETRPSLLRGSVLKFDYKIWREASETSEASEPNDRQLLAEGETVHVVCDSQMNKKSLPAPYAEVLRSMIAEQY